MCMSRWTPHHDHIKQRAATLRRVSLAQPISLPARPPACLPACLPACSCWPTVLHACPSSEQMCGWFRASLSLSLLTERAFLLADEKKTLLQEISGIAWMGELVAVMGPSGSGKTTLLTTLAGGARTTGRSGAVTTSGTLKINGESHSLGSLVSSRIASFVTQDECLLPGLTVRCVQLASALSAHFVALVCVAGSNRCACVSAQRIVAICGRATAARVTPCRTINPSRRSFARPAASTSC